MYIYIYIYMEMYMKVYVYVYIYMEKVLWKINKKFLSIKTLKNATGVFYTFNFTFSTLSWFT